MKKTISVILAIATLMSLLCISSFAASVSLVASPSKAKQGDIVTVSVNIPSGLSAFTFVLDYDDSSFEVVKVNKGSCNYSMFDANKQAGTITVGAFAMEELPACTAFSVQFKVLKTGGKMTLRVEKAYDGNDANITSSISGSSITITEAAGSGTPAPAPTQPKPAVPQNTKPAGQSGGNSGNKVTAKANKDKVEGVTGTAQAPAPDETLPAEIMPDATTTTTTEAVETEATPVEKSNKKAIIIAVVATVLAAAAAVVIVLVIKKKKEQEAPENQN